MPILVLLLLIALGVNPAIAAPEGPPVDPDHPPAAAPEHRPSDATDDATSHRPFDDVEEWASHFDSPSRAEWQKPEEVVKALDLGPGMNVADIGAGTGYFNRFLAAAVAPDGRVYAADTEPKMVEHMRRRAERERTPNVVAVLAAPDDPRLPAGEIDVILICNTYHHIDDRLGYFERIKKILRPGGRIAVVDYHKDDVQGGPPPEHRLPREHVIGELEAIGYRLVSEPTFLPRQYFLIFQVG